MTASVENKDSKIPAWLRGLSASAVIEAAVGLSLLLGMTVYILLPVMLAGSSFEIFARVPLVQTGSQVSIVLPEAEARGLLWFNALALSLAGYALFCFLVRSLFRVLPWRSLSLLVDSVLSYLVCSGSLVRAAADRIRMPDGAEVPIVYLSGWVDLPAVASSGFLEGARHSALFPLAAAGLAGVGLALYRIGRDNVRRRLAALYGG